MSTKFRLAGLLLGLALALLVGLPPLGRGADEGAAKNDDHKNQRNITKGEDRNHAKTNNAGKAVEDIDLACRLAEYGRRHKSAEALIGAAQILANVPPARAIDEHPKQAANKGNEAGNGHKEAGEKPSTEDNIKTARAWLAEARKLSDSPEVENKAKMVEQSLTTKRRGDIRGPQQGCETVPGGYHDDWGLKLRAGEVTNIAIVCDSPLAADLMDENANVVDSGYGTTIGLSVVPKWTGAFTLRITNNGGSSVKYCFFTN